MKITRRFTQAGKDVFGSVQWVTRTSRITNSDGSVVFEMKDAEVPKQWSQLATDIMVSKYFRKAGVPQVGDDGAVLRDDGGAPVTGPERSARQVIHRLAGCWRHWGQTHGYFDTEQDAEAFYDELCYMLLHQMAAPNSPQWFNTGLNWAYGISGPPQGHWVVDPVSGRAQHATDAYTHPQPHACFIQSVSDDLVNGGGIMDLWVREARLFKYGSGTGTNFSALRGEEEPLSGGGRSSGLMSFLKIGDRAAGAIKSGGTTRRAAKMVCLDADHPDIEHFVNWKVREELKVAAMVEGLRHLGGDQRQLAERLGLKLDYDFNGEAYYTVSGQNSNNSVRLSDRFLQAVQEDDQWTLYRRTDGAVARTMRARDLWSQICDAAWRCADPGVQFDTTINAWHTCPESGRINASNPCVTGETLVATATGYRRIESLVGESAEVIDGRGERAWVDRIFRTGHKPVYELRTRGGYGLRLTADHLVQTENRGDVPACELTLDDLVRLERPGFGDDFIPEVFGELLGAALAGGIDLDGDAPEPLVGTGPDDRTIAHHLQGDIGECRRWLGSEQEREAQSSGSATATAAGDGDGAAALRARLQRYAELESGAAARVLADRAFGLDRRSLASILRGLFTVGGALLDLDRRCLLLHSESLELLRQVQMLLLGFGVKARIRTNRRAIDHASALLPDGNGRVRPCHVKQVHSISIADGSRVVFEREIGLLAASHKARRLAELNQRCPAEPDAFVDRVRSLVPCGTADVFDLTEPRSAHFVANGLVVHNCSEYMFLDDTACNLASINLLRFYDADARHFDSARFEHAIDLWTIVLEVSVLMASFPSQAIAEQSYRFRTLGLGFANLGAMLMQAGIPYDSDEARALAGAISATLTGRAYATSARMAAELGPFPGFAPNRDAMGRVIRNHRRAAYGLPRDAQAWEELSIPPVPIEHELFREDRINLANASELLERATAAWDEALTLGEAHGYRNAQVTVIAPTGTIGLLMDCDTTGVEPDFALTKFKKLAGGGYFKIANQSLRPALKALGYSAEQIVEILTWVMGTLTVQTPMPVIGREQPEHPTFAAFLRSRGYTEDDLAALEHVLPSVFELGFAFTAWSMPAAVLEGLGIDAEAARRDPTFNGLRRLGLSDGQIGALNRAICGTQTVEGAPHLAPEHLPVFDCANRCGRDGQRFIHAQGHIRMMAASQPFISGAISKTINLPNEASVDDIADAYLLSWRLGLKANALYRDGSKLSQVLSTRSDRAEEDDEDDDDDAVEHALGEVSGEVAELASAISTSSRSSATTSSGRGGADAPDGAKGAKSAPVERIVERIIERPMRQRLPDTRRSLTHRFNVAGHEGYLTAGLYDDGSPGELFITMSKEGSTIGGLMDSLGTAISVALQYGVPIESLVKKFEHQRFEPMGMTTSRDIPFAKSLVDYIFRWLGMQFIPGYREANAPRRSSDSGRGAEPADRTRAKEQNAWLHDDEREGEDTPGTTPAATPAPARSVPAPGRRSALGEGRIDVSRGGAAARLHSESISIETDPAGSVRMTAESIDAVALVSPVDASNAAMQGDAPACENCGAITVRNGTCYRCLNCGASLGCS